MYVGIHEAWGKDKPPPLPISKDAHAYLRYLPILPILYQVSHFFGE